MDIISYKIDNPVANNSLVHFTIGGFDSSADYRLAQFSESAGARLDGETAVAWIETWLVDNAAAVTAAIESGELAASDQIARGANYGARAWYRDNPNAKLLFTLSIPDLINAIENRSAGQETLLLEVMAIALRVLARRGGLLD